MADRDDEHPAARAEGLAGVGTWSLDLETSRLTTNPAARSLLGWTRQDRLPCLADYLQAVHPEDRQRVADRLCQRSLRRQPVIDRNDLQPEAGGEKAAVVVLQVEVTEDSVAAVQVDQRSGGRAHRPVAPHGDSGEVCALDVPVERDRLLVRRTLPGFSAEPRHVLGGTFRGRSS